MNRRLKPLASKISKAMAVAGPPEAASRAPAASAFELEVPARGASAFARWKSKMLCGLVVAFVGMSGPALAAVIVSDNFGYADGALAGNSGGAGWSGAWAGQGTVAAGAASVASPQGVASSTRSLASAFQPVIGQSIYLGMRFGADPGATAGDFAGLSIFRGSGFTAADGVLFFGMPFENNAYGFAATGFNTRVTGVAASTQPSHLIAEILYNTQSDIDLWNVTVRMYVDPTGALDVADATYTGAVRRGPWTGIQLVNQNGRSTYDDFIISTTLSDVYAPTTAVPEPSSLALAGLALVGLGSTRRRRSAG